MLVERPGQGRRRAPGRPQGRTRKTPPRSDDGRPDPRRPPRDKAPSVAKGDLDQAVALAKPARPRSDAKGTRMLAASNGFSRANQIDQAIPWAEKAAANGSPPSRARLNLGDLLLTQSEAQVAEPEKARQLQDRALAEYDKILAAPARRHRGREQQGLDSPQLQVGRASRRWSCAQGLAPEGRPEQPPRRVLRHPRLDPGGSSGGPRTPRSRTRRA